MKPTIIYLVKQFQDNSEYWNTTIKVFSTRDRAENYRDTLNEEYYEEGVHWYEVEAIHISE